MGFLFVTLWTQSILYTVLRMLRVQVLESISLCLLAVHHSCRTELY